MASDPDAPLVSKVIANIGIAFFALVVLFIIVMLARDVWLALGWGFLIPLGFIVAYGVWFWAMTQTRDFW